MTADLLGIVARLEEEHEVAPPAAMMSNAAAHYDREVARLLLAGDKAVIPALVARAHDAREVFAAEPPHLPVEGGYGKAFGRVTVADKARFALARLLGPEVAEQAIAGGPAWWRAHGARLRWDAKRGRFAAR